jgi:outer membrane protein OmpA-like peptidoglycan-associated protein/ABC-type nitrate/sulfonate/bicarbonate transport system substrate-binding protein
MKNLIVALILLVAIVAGAFLVKGLLPKWQDRTQKVTSDARETQGTIRIANDNFMGYFFIRSPELKKAMRRAGWILEVEDDAANYAQRMQKLADEEIDFAVCTVDAYVLNGKMHNYPGTIIMIIDESKGADAILALKDKIANLDALKGMGDIRVAYTPDSPSHHLLKATSDHFNVPELLPRQSHLRVETDGSQAAVKALLNGKADVAVAWEPDVSKGLKDSKVVKLLGTEVTEKLIVDILLVNRKFAAKNPEVVKLFMTNYFKVLKKYRQDKALLMKDLKKDTGLSAKKIESVMQSIRWINFAENLEDWFGIGTYNEGLVDTIDSTITILKNAGDFKSNPLPDEDPYRLTYREFLEQLNQEGIGSGFKAAASGTAALGAIEAGFPALDEAGWAQLKVVGGLKVGKISFLRGDSSLNVKGKEIVDAAVDKLKHYPALRVMIEGHTGTRGDREKNRGLSLDRADAVKQYLVVTYNVDPDRLRAVGFGGAEPLPKKPGESLKGWRYRLPRVELVLVRESF